MMEVVKENQEAAFRHFSHYHPLVRSSTNSSPAANTSCFGCNLKILYGKDYYYRCKICPFNLHQACYNIPRKIRHPGHPIHYLNLLVMPSSAGDSSKCKACGQNVTGFYYTCAECGICYHILCSALPLSVSIHSHSHTLKLEYSLPYDFECDLCQKPCYNGWLYRCRLCEFDTHLSCTIANQRTESLQITPSSDGSENNELMQLVSQGIARHDHAVAAGWHETLHSPKQKLSMRNSGPPFQTKADNIIAAFGHFEHLDQSNLQSGELGTLTSHQFSDHSCFSIDIANSYKESNEANHQDVKQVISYRNDYMLDRITSNLEPAKKEVNRPNFNLLFMGAENRLNEVFLKRSGSGIEMESKQKNKTKKTGSRGSSEIIKDQRLISDKGRSKCSCWWKFLQFCCLSRYDTAEP
ncbi:hypothetical protein Ddye_014768 [Dipteronia dyeriana]|uniref:DC1 domain-containing protein n=1 Tax=Dipteronia dyeriana TaxID=168575 RepID=A0AAD9WX94_9ROSI|nr:hypothetical protein Ddye_014768 [Dipteronia dyeriana]